MTPDEAVDRAGLLLDVGRPEQAREILLQAGGPQASARVAFTLARAHLASSSYGDAIDAARIGLAQDPSSDWGHRLLAIVQLRQRNRAGALASATRAVELSPLNPAAHAVMADALRAQGDLARAAQHANEAVRLDPHEPSHHVLAGDVALDQRRDEAARDHFRAALELDPTNARAKNQLGVALHRLGDVAGARSHFVEAAPESETARRNVAMIEGRAGTGIGAGAVAVTVPGATVALPLDLERVAKGWLRVPADKVGLLPPSLAGSARRERRTGALLVRHPAPEHVAAFLAAAGPPTRTAPSDLVDAPPTSRWVLPPKVRARAKRQALRHLLPALVVGVVALALALAAMAVSASLPPAPAAGGADPGASELRDGLVVLAGLAAFLAMTFALTGASHALRAVSQAGGELARMRASLDATAVARMPVPYVRDPLLRRLGWRLGVPWGKRPTVFVHGRNLAHASIRAKDAPALVGVAVYAPIQRGAQRFLVTASGEVVTFRGLAPILRSAAR